MKNPALLLLLLSFSFAQYQISIVQANDSSILNLVYDDASASYADNSLENPDALLRVCALSAAELQNKYVSLMYADGTNPGDYIEITHFPVQITHVPPNNCVYLPLDIHSFRAWYPSIPFMFISDSPDMSGATRQKIIITEGWLEGNYTVNYTQAGNLVNITVTDALDDGLASIPHDVDYLVVGLMMGSTLTTTDTAITSLNDPVVLSLGSYTGPYYIHINGIGPGLFPPLVEIISPEPVTYSSGTIPFIYTITTYAAPVDSCWYILDGSLVNMPDCTISYILNVGQGTHSLFLYANDTAGNVGYDSVTFSVSAPAPPTPSEPAGGSGAPHIGIPFTYPVIPPSYEQFEIRLENLEVTVDYSMPGDTDFSLYSTGHLTGVECFITGEFEDYATVELSSDEIPAGGRVEGTIIIEMPPDVILDFPEVSEGLLQCVARTEDESLLLSTTANVYLYVHKPAVAVENITVEMLRGELENLSINLTSIGPGETFVFNMTVAFGEPVRDQITVTGIPRIIYNGESGILSFWLDIPLEFEPGIYRIPITIYETGRPVGQGILTLFVKEEIYISKCIFPDLRWTVIFLVAAVLTAIYAQRKEREKMQKAERMRPPQVQQARAGKPMAEGSLEKYKPELLALGYALLFFIIWAFIIWLLARCTYVTI